MTCNGVVSGAGADSMSGIGLLSGAEQMYGPDLTTSFAQGGSWFVNTPTGKIEGYLTSETQPEPTGPHSQHRSRRPRVPGGIP